MSGLDAEKDISKQENVEVIDNDNSEIHKTPIPITLNKLSASDSGSLERDNGMTGHSSNSDLTVSTIEKENNIKTIIINDPKSHKVSLSDDIINISNSIFDNLTPLQTRKRKERKERKEKNNNNEKDDDNNSDLNLMNSPPLDISDSENEKDDEKDGDENSYNYNDSDKRRKNIKEEEIKKISLSSFSWPCIKCKNLNSQKARSCDICGIKKPSVQVPLKKKIKEQIFILGVKQKQKPGRKPKIKVIENEKINMNNSQNSNLIKDVDKLFIVE